MSLGLPEIILILIVILVLFGGKKIPELARGLGKAHAEYQKAKEEIENQISEFNAESKNTSAAKRKTAKKTTRKTPAKKIKKK